ncbi:MAG: hypothetical protein ACRC62_12475 [Microcoleus sp.]
MLPTLSPLTFEELRHLIEWPADLLYEPTGPIVGSIPEQHGLGRLATRDRGNQKTAPVKPGWKLLNDENPIPELKELRSNLDNSKILEKPEIQISRPNQTTWWSTQQQQFKPNPFWEEQELDLDVSDGEGVLEGALFLITSIAQKIFDSPMVTRSTIELLTPSGALATLRGHALRTENQTFVDATIEYYQSQDYGLSELQQQIKREIDRWQDIGRAAVLDPHGEIDSAISLANVVTASIVLSKLLEKLHYVNGFSIGVKIDS